MVVRRLSGFGAAAAAAGVMLLSGCDVRWETEPPIFPSADAATLARDALADAEAGVLEAATREGAGVYERAAQAHLDVLGGVYVAYPDAPSPSPSAAPAPVPALTEAIAHARVTAADVASTTDDVDLAFLARSLDLEWALRGLWAQREAEQQAAADAEGAAGVSAAPTPLPTPDDNPPSDTDPVWFPRADGTWVIDAGFAPGAVTGIMEDTLSTLAVAEDEARFAYETLAAQEYVQARSAALARARLHGARSDALAALLDQDPRTPLYQLRNVDLMDSESRRALERSLETGLAVRYAVLLNGASAADAAWLLNASFDSYARAMRTEGFSATDVPTLPGLSH